LISINTHGALSILENACILFVTALVAALSNAPHLVSAADNVPKFDIARECRSEGLQPFQ
jgi:hypothetical protein